MEIVDGKLFVLSRGRVRGAGGVSAEVEDSAGTIFSVDPNTQQPISESVVSERIQNNGEVFASPTTPPFMLWNSAADPPHKDRETDRPYCGLRWHESTSSFYICAFSGVDKPISKTGTSFSKNLTDAILRFDTRTNKWSEVERHNIEAGGIYPHHDPKFFDPPHGWLNGPDNLLPVGDWLYAVAKDNSILMRYDLRPYIENPEAGAAKSEWVLGSNVFTKNAGIIDFKGHSALAYNVGWLYIASRTSSHIIRMKLDENLSPVIPNVIELLANFDPWVHDGPLPSDLTDMDFDSNGRLYIVSAKPSKVYRFTPDPKNIFDARNANKEPWINFAALTNNQKMKSENIMIDHRNTLFITSGDGYDFQYGAAGTVYKTQITD